MYCSWMCIYSVCPQLQAVQPAGLMLLGESQLMPNFTTIGNCGDFKWNWGGGGEALYSRGRQGKSWYVVSIMQQALAIGDAGLQAQGDEPVSRVCRRTPC